MSKMRIRLPVVVCVHLSAVCLASPWSTKTMGVPLPDYPDTVVATIPTGGWPWEPGATVDGRYVYVPGFWSDTVSVIRTSDNAIVAAFPLAGRPTVAVPSPDGQYMYISNSRAGEVAKVRLSDNSVVHRIPMLSDPNKMAFVQNGQYLYANIFRDEENHVAVLRTSDDSLLQYITVGSDPWGITVTADGQRCYVSCAYSDAVYVLRTSDHTVEAIIPVEEKPHGIALSPAEDLLYVACKYAPDLDSPGNSTAVAPSSHETNAAQPGVECLKVIRLSDQSLVATVPLPDPPGQLALLPNGKYLYVASYDSNYVAIIRTSDFSVVKIVTTGYAPAGLAMLPDGSAIYVAAIDEGCIRVIGNVDVGPVTMLSPSGTVDSGSVYQPSAVVRNFGPTSQILSMTMKIGAGYAQTVQETLASRTADTVVFPSWTAGPVGTLAVTCFTSLAGDEDPTNDTIGDSVRVVRPVANDVGAIAVLSPTGIAESGGVYVPRAVVRNFGRTPATFPVTMDVGAGYSQTAHETLASGVTDTVAFPEWTAPSVGSLTVTCFTSLVGDEVPANDTIRDSVRVVLPPRHDVGATAILSPSGSVRAGDAVIPKARIKNFGNAQERFFDVRFRIGTGYNEKVNVSDALPADSTVELIFPPWVAAAGNWAVSCSTMLASDVDSANDKASSSVQVFPQTLTIGPDQSDQLTVGQSETYRFSAVVQGDTGGVVAVARPASPSGWRVRLCDADGENDLTDTDSDGVPDLGYLAPSESGRFSLEVTAPSELQGDTAPLRQGMFLVAGYVSDYPLAADTAFLTLKLVPLLSIHNFPNPFSDHTAFVIGLPEDGKASLTVYTRDGARVCRVIENTDFPAGVHVVRWDGVNDNGRTIAPGTYEYVLDYIHAGKTDRIRKRLVLTRK